jgi:hypothetical protein
VPGVQGVANFESAKTYGKLRKFPVLERQADGRQAEMDGVRSEFAEVVQDQCSVLRKFSFLSPIVPSDKVLPAEN